MPFKLKCPKCGSTSVSIFRERGGFGPPEGEPVLSCRCGTRVYGKERIEKEYLRQRKTWVEPVLPDKPTFTKTPSKMEANGIRMSLQNTFKKTRELVRSIEEPVREVRELELSLGHRRQEDPASFALNRLDIEVATIQRILSELKSDIQSAKSTPQLYRVASRSQYQVKDIREIVTKIPDLARKADSLLREHHAAVTTCAWKNCNAPAAPDRKYCSPECRKKKARYDYRKRKAVEKKLRNSA